MATAPRVRHHLSREAKENGWVEDLASLNESHGATDILMKVSEADGTAAPAAMPEDGQENDADLVEAATSEALLHGELLLSLEQGPRLESSGDLDSRLESFRKAANDKEVDLTVLLRKPLDEQAEAGPVGAEVLLRRRATAGPSVEIRVAVIGNVDSGKSTLVGCLTRGMTDDGRGLARSKVFKHRHEEATGRTSSIGQHNLCLDSKGAILNDSGFKTQTSADYVARSSKCITLVDLAGHERYFKSTAYGLTAHLPDYACLIVGANAGIVGMAKEHLGVALALRIPCFFVVTKVDIAPGHVLQHTLDTLCTILRKPGVRKKPFMVRNVADVITCAKTVSINNLAPIFLSSSVTGDGLQLVRLFFNLLPLRQRWADRVDEATEFIIDETFQVAGVGTVVAGTVKRGQITTGSSLLLGPDLADGNFRLTTIKSLHYKRLAVQRVVAGSSAALALKKTKRSAVRKGMVLVAASLQPKASWEFDADIAILTHSTSISPRYQAVVHCDVVRQTARVVAMDRECLRSGDRAVVRFRFLQRPEYLQTGTRFVFREGRTKGIGLIVACC